MRQSTSTLEYLFRQVWDERAPKHLTLIDQCYFDLDKNWRFDFAIVDKLIAVECVGGTWMAGRHNRGTGMTEDFTKHNAATIAGWRIFYATTDMLNTDPWKLVKQIAEFADYPALHHSAEHSMWVARVRNLTNPGQEIINNGITIRRERGAKYTVTLAKSEHIIKAKRVGEAQRQVLSLILTSPSKAVMPSLMIDDVSATLKAAPLKITQQPPMVIGITDAVGKAAPESIPVEYEAPAPKVTIEVKPSPPMKPEDDISNYFKSISAPPPKPPVRAPVVASGG